MATPSAKPMSKVCVLFSTAGGAGIPAPFQDVQIVIGRVLI